jgi:hypothetical protein
MCNEEEFEETKGVIRIRKSTKDCQHNGKKKEQTMIYETLHIKLKIEKYKRYLKQGVKSGAAEGLVVPAPLVAPIVLL